MTADPRALIDRIRAAAAGRRRAVPGLAPERLASVPAAAGAWPAHETPTHLRDAVVLVHGFRIRRLLHEPDACFAEHDRLARLLAALPGGVA